MQRDDVAVVQQVRRTRIAPAQGLEGRVAVLVIAQHRAPEAQHDAREDGADLAGADNAHHLAVQVKPHQAVEFEVTIARARAGSRDLAIHRQQQADSELGNRIRRVVGDALAREMRRVYEAAHRTASGRIRVGIYTYYEDAAADNAAPQLAPSKSSRKKA